MLLLLRRWWDASVGPITVAIPLVATAVVTFSIVDGSLSPPSVVALERGMNQ